MVNPSLNELKTIVKIRDIKGYKSMSEERLLSVLKWIRISERKWKEFYWCNNRKDQKRF